MISRKKKELPVLFGESAQKKQECTKVEVPRTDHLRDSLLDLEKHKAVQFFLCRKIEIGGLHFFGNCNL